MSLPDNLPTPRQLARQLDRGQITREEYRKAMTLHALEVIEEMKEVHQNPFAAYINSILDKRAAQKLAHRHGEQLVREVLVALSEVRQFPPAHRLWNALQPLSPLHCFLRMRQAPIFRILHLDSQPWIVTVRVEYGTRDPEDGTTREEFHLRRDHEGFLVVERRFSK